MSLFGWLFGNDDSNRTDYVVKEDGRWNQYDRQGNRTDVYTYDPKAKYEKDPKGRDHGHVVIKDDKVAHVRNDKGESFNFDKKK